MDWIIVALVILSIANWLSLMALSRRLDHHLSHSEHEGHP